ncbi:hypothetical protein Micbo1qcDRAFT_220216 [Microdochium bolleyi]|uniref:Uncharacterized protein n=1 Tax=Microdochium bolleyi TaxID=196109 RepID=A0A136ILQ8_9PEZI|nr:hypothetical protein Micbo1qcDRAFT_220216 [Microdochium bolleyi]
MVQVPSHPIVYPFTISTQHFEFREWVTIFTVSLAPLIAHLAAGTPRPSILTTRSSRRPRWHDSICVYNPTSILWRYAAIADRRIRAKYWSVEDIAAANALFWFCEERGGWNGTEQMIIASLPYCTELPLHARAELLSWETIKTIIITLQGMQALATLANFNKIIEGRSTGAQDSVLNVFSPFTLIGLFRLCAAGYLTPTGYAYTARDNVFDGYDRLAHSATVLDNELGTSAMAVSARYHSTKYIPSILFRCTYMLLLFSIWTISLLRGTPAMPSSNPVWERTTTTMLSGCFYLFFTSCTCALLAVYFWRGDTRSTIIPCAGKVWYKIYTVVVFAWMVTIFVVACCETLKMPCGVYSSLGEDYWHGRDGCESSAA